MTAIADGRRIIARIPVLERARREGLSSTDPKELDRCEARTRGAIGFSRTRLTRVGELELSEDGGSGLYFDPIDAHRDVATHPAHEGEARIGSRLVDELDL